MDTDWTVQRLIIAVCSDTNYKIRTDGAIFFKQYFKANHEQLVNTPRMQQTYIPEICELLNDEEIYIKIEAVEALTFVMDSVDIELLEKEMVPNFLKLLNIENPHEEVMIRMS